MFDSNLCPAELSTGSVFLTNLNQFTTPWTKEAKQIHHTLQLLTFKPRCPWCHLSLGFLTWPGLGSVSSADFPPAKQPWLHRCMAQVQIVFYFSADLGKIQRIFHLNYIGGIYPVGWSRMAPRKYEIIWNRPFEGPFLDSCRCTFQKKQMLIINTQNVTYMAPD